MTQDGNMGVQHQWLVTKYDDLNRPVETGIWTNGSLPDVHRSNAGTSTNYPETSTNYEQLSVTHYDNYDGLPSGLTATFNNSWSAECYSTYNTAPQYAQELTAVSQILGMVGWTKSKVLATANDFLYSVNLYDSKGRVIQVKSINITGGQDVLTTQYSWSGQPLITVSYTNVGGTTAQHITQVSRFTYDELSRLVITEKKTAYGIAPGSSLSGVSYVTIAELSYDAVGNLQQKKIGGKKDASTGQYYSPHEPLETLQYNYNIRGWQLGMNRDMVKSGNTTNYFGYDIGYDITAIKKSDQTPIGSYSMAAYNGNIAGISWRSVGDDELRKYDYTYDAANRLLKADFTQYSSGTTWSNADVDFTVKMGDGINAATAYDPNGNIKRMQQWGLKLAGSVQIDDLTYGYYGNRLNYVNESTTIGSTNSGLGDFTDGNRVGNEYGFDRNANMVTDLNKNLVGGIGGGVGNGAIQYNHLNLPKQITVSTSVTGETTKGTIYYLYTAEGVKLEKRVVENNVAVLYNGNTVQTSVTTLTRYINGAVLESKSYGDASVNTALGYTNHLQFAGQEEGRVRAVYQAANPGVFDRFEYDYMIKDHLGNVRMVLTEEVKKDEYPAATMETGTIAAEETLYANLSNTQYNKPSWFSDPQYPTNAKVARLKNESGSQKIGPGIVLKVMAGDSYNIRVTSGWNSASLPANSSTNVLSDLLQQLSTGVAGLSGGKVTAGELQSGPGSISSALIDFLGTQTTTGDRPKAYINWILLDERFRIVEEASGFEQVSESGVTGIHTLPGLSVPKNGYLYIYTSNESANIDVFFDNLQVTHIRGALLEETHYYPFGLTMAGISSKALEFGNPPNRQKWNAGSELANKEFSDGYGLELYETFYRSLDPQIGRFWQIDPEIEAQESYSPYESMGNNPISNVDPLGDFKTKFGAKWHRFWHGGGTVGQNEYGEWYVTKSKIVENEAGEAVAKSWKYYGKGRDKYSTAREALLKDMEIENDIMAHGGKRDETGQIISTGTSMYQMYDSPEDAGKAALSLGTGVVIPNPVVRSGTIAVNATQLANKGKKIVEGIRKTISLQKQARHLVGTAKQGGGFLNSVADAQKVLDAVHSGEAVFLGTTKAGQPVFRYSGVTGTNVNIGAGFSSQPTNVFIIKGTTNPTVVPTNPAFF